MTVSRTYTYLGKTDKGYQIWEGVYSFAAIDTYSRTDRMTLTFAGMKLVKGILGITGLADAASNLGNPVVMSDITNNIVTLNMLETGAIAGAVLAEKTNAEQYGVAGSVRCLVFGL